MLQVRGNQIIDEQGKEFRLRGTCIGGWMNMENFINAYPGDEHGLRAALADALGKDKAQFFFDRWHDAFLTEEDIAFIKSCGATVVRLPLNYRHFERDDQPFTYLQTGFERLDKALGWCAKHNLLAILDLHAVQGWQNNDWHCDNSSRHTHFWQHAQFQDRYVGLWEEFARHYKDREIIAGYNVMNEPVSNAPAGRFYDDKDYKPDWDIFNAVNRRVVKAIRAIDPDHIIFLEGDLFSSRFAKMEAPIADNLVYSSHNYAAATYASQAVPLIMETGKKKDQADVPSVEHRKVNVQRQREIFLAHEGTQFTQRYNVPLWVGEFGAPSEYALEDQVSIFEEFGVHWTIWTYKDVGPMGFMNVTPDSKYMKTLAPVIQAKRDLGVDNWLVTGLPGTVVGETIVELAEQIEKTIPGGGIDSNANRRFLAQSAIGIYAASMLQPAYARCLKGLSETELDAVVQSFAFKNCQPRKDLVKILKKFWK